MRVTSLFRAKQTAKNVKELLQDDAVAGMFKPHKDKISDRKSLNNRLSGSATRWLEPETCDVSRSKAHNDEYQRPIMPLWLWLKNQIRFLWSE